ncbi:MAG: hypothetical protein NTW14_12975 [bacterium]|nr:hypothetical protein [bacterium]
MSVIIKRLAVLFLLLALIIGCSQEKTVTQNYEYTSVRFEFVQGITVLDPASWPDEFPAHVNISGSGFSAVSEDLTVQKNPANSTFWALETVDAPVGITLNIDVTAEISGDTWQGSSSLTLDSDSLQLVAITLRSDSIIITPFSEGFEAGSYLIDHWVSAGGCVVVSDTVHTGNYALRGDSTWEIHHDLAAVPGGVFQFSCAILYNSGNDCPLVTYATKQNRLIYVNFDTLGYLTAFNGSTLDTIAVGYESDVWHELIVYFDASAELYDLYLDGVELADNFAFLTSANQPPRVAFQGNGIAYIDDVYVGPVLANPNWEFSFSSPR